MDRPDLHALNPDALAALANRGLVKRAMKDPAPTISTDDTGTVRGEFADGVVCTLPPGELAAGTCTCAAPGICRHKLGVVLAYQQQSAVTPAVEHWSPGAFTDEDLAGAVGARALAAARRALKASCPARVRRPTEDDPVARVELAACSVRFLVPGELGHVHTDAADAVRGELIVLAVWAFRAADERFPTESDVRVELGSQQPTGGDLSDAVDLASELLLDGAMNVDPVRLAQLHRCHDDLTTRNLPWPAGAVADLIEQLDSYRERGTHYRASLFAELITELHARQRATGARAEVLGADEPAETPLRRMRLTSLGCRITGTSADRTAEVFLAHGDAGIVLVLRQHWALGEGQTPTGHQLGARRLAGSTLAKLAASNVVSESAFRSPSRLVRIGSGRIAKTTVSPVGGTAWLELPDTVLVRDLAALDAEFAALPPRLIRPRIEAESVRVVVVGEVGQVRYHPGDQRLDAVLRDENGTAATISATYRSSSPAALDTLAEALTSGPRCVSGALRRSRGGLVLDPLAVLVGAEMIVPDLAAGDGDTTFDTDPFDPHEPVDRVAGAISAALSVCAEAAHRGLRHLSSTMTARIGRAADELATVGLRTTADQVRAITTTTDKTQQVNRWLAAHLRLITTAELH